MNFYKNKQSGYSMMELLVYIAIFAVLSLVLVRSLISIITTYSTAQSYRAIQNNGELVMERITREIRASKSVVSSACGTNNGSITINSTDSLGASHTNTFSVNNGVLSLSTDGGQANSLTTSEVTVSSIYFCPFSTTNSSGIKVVLTLTNTSKNLVTASFYDTVLLREK